MKLTKNRLKEIIREEIKNLNEGSGRLSSDQFDVLQGIVEKNKKKKPQVILKLVMKDRMFKGVDKKELLGAIQGAIDLAKYF
jgi:hypothetical protein